MSNIEPTEEQKQAAKKATEKVLGNAECCKPAYRVARLLAEREAKLQARIDDLTERSARRLDDSTAIDALVYAIACLELQPGSERDRAVRDALNRVIDHVGAIEVRARDSATKVVSTLVAGAKAREDALTTRVAELEVSQALLFAERDKLNADLFSVAKNAHEREAQHLADIKACVGVIEGLLTPSESPLSSPPRSAVSLLARLAHYYDAKADGPAEDWQAWANGSCPEPGCSLANPHEQGVACVKPTAEGGAR